MANTKERVIISAISDGIVERKDNLERLISGWCSGLMIYNNYIYHTLQQGSGPHLLVKCSLDFKVVASAEIMDDGHSVFVFEGGVILVNPSYRTIQIFDHDLILCETIFVPMLKEVKKEDRAITRVHVNCAFVYKGILYYSVCFLPDSPKYTNTEDYKYGYIMSIQRGEHAPVLGEHRIVLSNLYLPHSVQIYNNYIYFCNTVRKTFEKYTLEGKFICSQVFDRWTRGLCYNGSRWIVGLSSFRGADDDGGAYVIVREEEDAFYIEETFELTGVREVYDIISMED